MPKIKEHFTSRYNVKCTNCDGAHDDYYGEGYPCDQCDYDGYSTRGYLIECDWSQLEVVVFAYLTQDSALLRDITRGTDIHKVMYSKLYNIKYDEVTKEQRSGIKACTFHVIYGGGAKSMSIRTGLDEELCRRFIEEFYMRYPMAKMWQDNLVENVKSTARLINEYTESGNQKHQGHYKSITGRKYIFKTKDSPDYLQKKGIKTSFNPPDIKNYPVQGLATADIHLIALGMLFREAIKNRDKFVLINTVHDSVLVDCRKEFVLETCNLMISVLELVVQRLKDKFNIEFNVPLKVECKYGTSWDKMIKYEVK